MDDPTWLLWARELQAIAQTGLTFSNDHYDLERYQRLRAISVAMMAAGSGAPMERISALFEQDLGYGLALEGLAAVQIRGWRMHNGGGWPGAEEWGDPQWLSRDANGTAADDGEPVAER